MVLIRKCSLQLEFMLLFLMIVTVSSITVNVNLERNNTSGLWNVKKGDDYQDLVRGSPGAVLPGTLDLQHRFFPPTLNYSTFAFAKLMLTAPVTNKSCESDLIEWFGNMMFVPNNGSSYIKSKTHVPKCVGAALSVGGVVCSWINPKLNTNTNKNFATNPISIKYSITGQSYYNASVGSQIIVKDKGPIKPMQFLNDMNWKDWKMNSNNSGVVLQIGVQSDVVMLLLDMSRIETLDSSPFKNNSNINDGSRFKWKPTKSFNMSEKSSVLSTLDSQHLQKRKKFENTVTVLKTITKSGTGTNLNPNITPAIKVTPSTLKPGLLVSGAVHGKVPLSINKPNIFVGGMTSESVTPGRTQPFNPTFPPLPRPRPSTPIGGGGWVVAIKPVAHNTTNSTSLQKLQNHHNAILNLPDERRGRVVNKINATKNATSTITTTKEQKTPYLIEYYNPYAFPHPPPTVYVYSGQNKVINEETSKKLVILSFCYLSIFNILVL